MAQAKTCLLYTSDAADEEESVDLGGRRIIKKKYEKDINFVFLNVDNPKWEKYIRNFNVNGIPQINIFDNDSNLELTFIGKQEEETIKESLDNLYDKFRGDSQILNSEFSIIKNNKNYQSSPRSHG